MSKAKEFRGRLPSVKAKEIFEQSSQREQEKERQQSELRGAITRLSETEDGMIFLRWLKTECGFGNSYLALNGQTGTIDEKLTVYQAIRLNLWWKVRQYLPIKKLIEVEHV